MPAHMSLPGANEIMNGFLHPLIVPSHVLILLGLGIALGQHQPLKLRPLVVFAIVAAVALGSTLTGWIANVPPVVLSSLALAVGGVVALGRPLPAVLIYPLVGSAAVAMGLDSGPESLPLLGGLKSVLGTWVSLSAWLATIAFWTSQGVEQNKPWLTVGLRVAGSWIFAISLLVLAFALKK